jgi:transposase, IS5 family
MVTLLDLKHAFNESGKDVIQRWGETPTWQHFSSNEYSSTSGRATPHHKGACAKPWANKA